MIRSVTPNDTPAVTALAEASGLFQAHELEELDGGLTDYFDGDQTRSHFWLTGDSDLEGSLRSVGLLCAGSDDRRNVEPPLYCRPSQP